MDNFRRYQPSFRTRRGPGPVVWVRGLIVAAGAILVIVFVWRLAQSEPRSSSSNGNAAPLLDVATGNTNAASPSNTNTAAPAGTLSAAQCSTVRSRGADRPNVALTFTAGSGVGQAERIRDLLKERQVPAAFFVSGQWAETHRDVAKSLADAGFTLGNGTYDRTDPTTLTPEKLTEQLAQAETAIQAATGRSSKPFFRPPQGAQNEAVVKAAQAAGYCTVLWSVDAFDWQDGQTADGAVTRVLERGGNGAIIVLQVASDLVVETLPKLIDAVKAKGLTFGTLDAVLAS